MKNWKELFTSMYINNNNNNNNNLRRDSSVSIGADGLDDQDCISNRIETFTMVIHPDRFWVSQSLCAEQILTREIKRKYRETDYSFPTSAELKNALSYTSTPPIHLDGMALT
jgi:hypothetical protein